MTWADQSTYTGDFFEGKADGYGVKKYADGSIYEGDWKADIRHTVSQEAKFFNAQTGKESIGMWKQDREVVEGATQDSPWGNMRKVVNVSHTDVKHQTRRDAVRKTKISSAQNQQEIEL